MNLLDLARFALVSGGERDTKETNLTKKVQAPPPLLAHRWQLTRGGVAFYGCLLEAVSEREALRIFNAETAEPVLHAAPAVATASQAHELRELILSVVGAGAEAEEALSIGLSDIAAALTSWRALAADVHEER